MALGDEARSSEVAEKEGFDARRLDADTGETFLRSLDGERAQVTIGKGSERSFAKAGDGDWTHF
jgi:hypothetical protein